MPSEFDPLKWKEEGNSYFAKSDFTRAARAYEKGLHEIERQELLLLEEKNLEPSLRHVMEVTPLKLTLLSNLAMAYIKVGCYEMAEQMCNVILQQDPKHVKGKENLLTVEEKKEKLHQAVDDLNKCSDILDSQSDQKAMKASCKKLWDEVKEILNDPSCIPDQKQIHPKENDGKTMSSGLGQYLSMNLTLLPADNPRLPMSTMKHEMLAVRLIGAMEMTAVRHYEDGRIEKGDFAEEGKEILNKILTTVAQAPFCLFPATGSQDRCPPITVHLLAFYLRACLSEAALEKFGVEKFCREATGDIISEEEAYAIASHGYLEVEAEHSPMRGHAKSFGSSSQGPCMPCTFRLLRSGVSDWDDGLRQSCHLGIIEWTACALNRLIENAGGGKQSVVDEILKCDEAGCNSVMHAANDNTSGYAGLTIRMLVQAASFSTKNFDEKTKVERKLLNTIDTSGSTPAMASVVMKNRSAMEALVDLGARLWDPKVNKRTSKDGVALYLKSIDLMVQKGLCDQHTCNMVCALKTVSEDRECCSYCGKSPANNKLLYCARCNRARYCNKDCQKRGYKKHKFVCSTAKVEQDVSWYNANISVPRP